MIGSCTGVWEAHKELPPPNFMVYTRACDSSGAHCTPGSEWYPKENIGNTFTAKHLEGTFPPQHGFHIALQKPSRAKSDFPQCCLWLSTRKIATSCIERKDISLLDRLLSRECCTSFFSSPCVGEICLIGKRPGNISSAHGEKRHGDLESFFCSRLLCTFPSKTLLI